MLTRHIAIAALLGVAAATTSGAEVVHKVLRPVGLPPAGYTDSTWVDSRGCTFYKDEAGQWIGALHDDGSPVCGPKPALGAISPVTGYPVPPGYRVVWTDGRLNPVRGPLSSDAKKK